MQIQPIVAVSQLPFCHVGFGSQLASIFFGLW